MKTFAATLAVALTLAGSAAAQPPQPGEVAFRSLYKELVETNTIHHLTCGARHHTPEHAACKGFLGNFANLRT